MLNRLALVVVVTVAISTPRTVAADPITYDFTGQLNQPFNGSTAFSGSLTFDATPTSADASFGVQSVGENGSGVSLTLNAGGQVFNFVNSPQDPLTSAGISAVEQPDSSPGPDVVFSFGGTYGNATGNGSTIKFIAIMYDYGPATVPSNLASLSFPASNSEILLQNLTAGSGIEGAFTSFEMVSTPEPGTLPIFAGLGIAALVRHRHRSRRGRGWAGVGITKHQERNRPAPLH